MISQCMLAADCMPEPDCQDAVLLTLLKLHGQCMFLDLYLDLSLLDYGMTAVPDELFHHSLALSHDWALRTR